MAAHTYWRLLFTANNGDTSWTSGVEIEMMAVPGGTDQCSGGTAIGSSGYYPLANAYDNNTGTIFAQANSSNPNWIGYQFASPVNILQFTFTCENTGYTNRAPKDFQLQWSDDNITWTTVYSLSGEVSWGALEKRTYSRVFITGNITESLAITDWRIAVNRCSDGVLVGTSVSTGATYSVNCFSIDACNVTIAPKIDGKWAASTAITSGYYVVPTNPDTTPRLYKCTTSGTTGSTEPTWPTSGTVTDGTAVWTFIDNLPNPVSLGCKIPA